MRQFARASFGAAAAISLSGCAVMDSIHWKFPGPGESQVFTVDAKQRHLIMARNGTDGVKACAEPAPDTFAAYSTSLLGLLGLAPPDREIQASVAAGETVATLERTQTVNLLREMYYRTCERWLSGALDADSFVTLSARDHRSMVAVMAIEQLTGVVKPAATIISGPAVSAAMGQNEKLVELLAGYKEERHAAEKALDTATKDYDAVNKEKIKEGEAEVPVCTVEKEPEDAAAKEKWSKCKPAADKVKAAQTALATAQSREKSVLDQLKLLAGGLSSAVSPGQQSNPGSEDSDSRLPERPSGNDLAVLVEAVKKIVLSPGIDEALMFCVGYLNSAGGTNADTRATCNNVVAGRATQDLLVQDEIYKLDGTPAEIKASDTRVSAYRSFKERIAGLIARTPESDWQTFWGPFKEALGPWAVDDCGSRDDCARVWSQAAPYFEAHRNLGDRLVAAADVWDRNLARIGR